MQNMVLIICDEGVISEGVLSVIGDSVVKGGGSFEGLVKMSFARSTIIDRDREFNFAWTFFTFDNHIKTDEFVTGGLIFQTIIEIGEIVLKREVNEAIADFHSGHG